VESPEEVKCGSVLGNRLWGTSERGFEWGRADPWQAEIYLHQRFDGGIMLIAVGINFPVTVV